MFAAYTPWSRGLRMFGEQHPCRRARQREPRRQNDAVAYCYELRCYVQERGAARPLTGRTGCVWRRRSPALDRIFRRSAVPPFRRSAVPPFRRSAVPPFRRSAVPPFRRSAFPPFRPSAGPPFRRSAVPPFRRSAVPPFRRSAVGLGGTFRVTRGNVPEPFRGGNRRWLGYSRASSWLRRSRRRTVWELTSVPRCSVRAAAISRTVGRGPGPAAWSIWRRSASWGRRPGLRPPVRRVVGKIHAVAVARRQR